MGEPDGADVISSGYKRQVLAATEPALSRLAVALSRQAQRIADDDFEEAMPEMESFVIGLARLEKVALVLRHIGLDVDPLLHLFDASTPNARTARNVFSHYEDYLLGEGREQPARGVPVTMHFGRGTTAGTAIHMTNPDITVEVGTAIGAAEDLAYGLLELIDTHRTSLHFDTRLDGASGGSSSCPETQS